MVDVCDAVVAVVRTDDVDGVDALGIGVLAYCFRRRLVVMLPSLSLLLLRPILPLMGTKCLESSLHDDDDDCDIKSSSSSSS